MTNGASGFYSTWIYLGRCGYLRHWVAGSHSNMPTYRGPIMTRIALTALALIGVAIWLDDVDGAGTLLGTLVLIAVFLTVGALFFCILSGVGAL